MTVEERDLGGPAALGERIKQARLRQHLTAVTAGKAAGISREYWAFFEAGRRRDSSPFKPEPSTILAVAKVAEIDGAEALRVYGHDPAFYRDGLEGRPRVSQEKALAKVKQLSPEDLAILEPLVDRLLREGGHIPPMHAQDPIVVTYEGDTGQIVVIEEEGAEAIQEGSRDHRPQPSTDHR